MPSPAQLTTVALVSLSTPLALYFVVVGHQVHKADESQDAQVAIEEIVLEPPASEPVFDETVATIKRHSTAFDTLRAAEVSADDAVQIIAAARDVYDLANVKADAQLKLRRTVQPESRLFSLSMALSPSRTLVVERASSEDGVSNWTARIDEVPIITERRAFQGTVQANLWESSDRASMPAQLVPRLAEIFAWQLDFERELRPGDRWRLTVEEQFIEGHAIGFARILAAEYQTSTSTLSAVLQLDENENSRGYFFPDGQSLRRMFLKSPLRFGRISSRFQRNRFHPILKIRRPHNGVDYAAAPGTPILSVGDGVVRHAKRDGIHGNWVQIRHNSTYETSYSHMRAFAKGLRRGQKVRQGQVIGYIGSTGLATGPHLHFAFYENGRFVDPLGRKFPSADPITASEMPAFNARASSLLAALPRWHQEETARRDEASEPQISSY